jgi:hypothetical protein
MYPEGTEGLRVTLIGLPGILQNDLSLAENKSKIFNPYDVDILPAARTAPFCIRSNPDTAGI